METLIRNNAVVIFAEAPSFVIPSHHVRNSSIASGVRPRIISQRWGYRPPSVAKLWWGNISVPNFAESLSFMIKRRHVWKIFESSSRKIENSESSSQNIESSSQKMISSSQKSWISKCYSQRIEISSGRTVSSWWRSKVRKVPVKRSKVPAKRSKVPTEKSKLVKFQPRDRKFQPEDVSSSWMSQSSQSSRSSTVNPEVAGIPEGGLDSSQFNMTSLKTFRCLGPRRPRARNISRPCCRNIWRPRRPREMMKTGALLVWPWNKSTCRFAVIRMRINEHKSPQ